MNLRTIVTGGACFASGLLLGMLFQRESVAITSPQTEGSNAAQPSGLIQDTELFYAAPQSREQQLSHPAEHADSPEPLKLHALEDLSGLSSPNRNGPLVVVPASLIKTLSQAGQVRSLDGDLFTDNTELANYLQLDDVEKQALESNWIKFRKQIRDLEAQSASFNENVDGTVEVILPEMNQQIATLRKQFSTSAEATLGSNRAEVLLAATQLQRMTDALASARSLTISAEETGDGGWRYHTIVKTSQGKRTYVGETIPPSLQHLTGSLEIVAYDE